jgi:sugar lactone lactonase YvrE
VYGGGRTHFLYEITQGIATVRALAFDSQGNLYVDNQSPSCIVVYAAGSKKHLYTINNNYDGIAGIAIDAEDHLYVPYPQGVFVYAPRSRKVSRKIRGFTSTPGDVAIDGRGRLYVVDGSFIREYASGSDKLIRTMKGPNRSEFFYIAVDGSDNVYGINYVEGASSATVLMYGPTGSSPKETITKSSPISLALDGSGNLFVLTAAGVSEYLPGQSAPFLTYTGGISAPSSLAVDAAGDLFVANTLRGKFGVGSVNEYQVGNPKLSRRLSNKINDPYFLAVGP